MSQHIAPEVEAEIDAILEPVKAANPGISNGEIVNYLPSHLRAPFWERAVGRYLDGELARLGCGGCDCCPVNACEPTEPLGPGVCGTTCPCHPDYLSEEVDD